jgi:hypothetical protein
MATAFLTPDIQTAKRRRLELLEQRAATQGRDTPPDVKIEIEDLRNELASATTAPASEIERYGSLVDALQDMRVRIDSVGRRVDQILWLVPILMVLLCGFLVLLVK